MAFRYRSMTAALCLGVSFVGGSTLVSAQEGAASDLSGLWEARRQFGPRIRGAVAMVRQGEEWVAEVGAHHVRAREVDGWITFALPGGLGSFRGRLEDSGELVGHWTQPETRHGGMPCASPVALVRGEEGTWRGNIVPLEDEFTFFLVVGEAEDGVHPAFLRNPDRNFGVFARADRIERQGDEVRLLGTWRGSDAETVLSRGVYEDEAGGFSLFLRGASFDFRRVEDPASAFYARAREPERWVYHAPPALGDGWSVASLADVGMTEEPIRELIHNVIDLPARHVSAPYVHGMLIARHGKLVVEEYFHGFHRDIPHDTRSASKSLTSVLVGAAMEAGDPVDLSMPVYETVGAPYFHGDLDERAQAMSLVHLLTMTSGIDCDDGDGDSPGNENTLQSQEDNPDWYDYTLRLDMIREPGEKAVYCSVNPNLIGSVLRASTSLSLEALFHERIAKPLDFGRYHWYLQPTGEPYMGGGSFFLARDFLKLGQLMLDGGTWNGRRVLAESFAAESVEPLVQIGSRDYGYLWWVSDLTVGRETVRAFYAGGNGGQVVMGVPELDLVALFFAGNYSDDVMFLIQEELVPQFVLRAVE